MPQPLILYAATAEQAGRDAASAAAAQSERMAARHQSRAYTISLELQTARDRSYYDKSYEQTYFFYQRIYNEQACRLNE